MLSLGWLVGVERESDRRCSESSDDFRFLFSTMRDNGLLENVLNVMTDEAAGLEWNTTLSVSRIMNGAAPDVDLGQSNVVDQNVLARTIDSLIGGQYQGQDPDSELVARLRRARDILLPMDVEKKSMVLSEFLPDAHVKLCYWHIRKVCISTVCVRVCQPAMIHVNLGQNVSEKLSMVSSPIPNFKQQLQKRFDEYALLFVAHCFLLYVLVNHVIFHSAITTLVTKRHARR
jgi:hypothetical protein